MVNVGLLRTEFGSPNDLDLTMINSYFTNGDKQYLDAIGYSWDPNYNIGDNQDEGLLLSFDNSTNLEWMGYSLDGQANKTILGNTTILMLDIGSHSIQVFGNDSLGSLK